MHKKGKLYMAHMDGKLKSAKDLIARTDIDIIEGFTPPMGNLSLQEEGECGKTRLSGQIFPLRYAGEERRKFDGTYSKCYTTLH